MRKSIHTSAIRTVFLKGKNKQVIDLWLTRWNKPVLILRFEAAARYRDQIGALNKVQEQQWVSGNQQEMDVFGFAYRNGIAVIQCMFIRDNKLLGSKSFYPKVPPSRVMQKCFNLLFYSFTLRATKLPLSKS